MESLKRLAMLTSPASRDGHGSTLHHLLREYGEHLREYEIHATRGTYNALVRTGLFRADKLKAYLPGQKGGVVEIAKLAIDHPLQAIALLLDPGDPFAESAENLALQRACIIKKIPQLMNFGDFAHWIEYEADPERVGSGSAYIKVKEDVVALVAHDKKKKEMLDFFSANADFLTRKHLELIATGTTGELVLQLCLGTSYNQLEAKFHRDRWKDIGHDESVESQWATWLRTLQAWHKQEWRITLDQPAGRKRVVQLANQEQRTFYFTLYESGPYGGDIQIANRILEGGCGAVLFFHDPQTPHPHDPDIRLCIRTCQLPDVKVTLRRDLDSAQRWATGCMKDLRSELRLRPELRFRPELQPLDAPAHHWPMQVLAMADAGIRQEGQNQDQVRQLARAGAGYVDELLHELLSSGLRRQTHRRVLVLVPWGSTACWTVDALKDVVRGPYGDSLVIAPMAGLTGEVSAWQFEAAAIADKLALLYRAKRRHLESPAFVARDPANMPPGVQDLRNEIKNLLEEEGCFVVAFTGLRPWPPKMGGLRRYPEIVAPGATVDLCGMFLNDEGPVSPCWAPTTPEAQQETSANGAQTVIPLDLLKKIAESGRQKDRAQRRGEVIVICGYNDNRIAPLATAIKWGLVNTLVTDVTTRDRVWEMIKGPPCDQRTPQVRAGRLPRRIPIQYEKNGEWLDALTVNISKTGVLFGPTDLEKTAEVQIRFPFPTGNCDCTGEIKRAVTETRMVAVTFASSGNYEQGFQYLL